MHWLLVGVLVLFCCPLWAGHYVLSFDDAPNADAYFTGQERTERLIAALKHSGIEEAVFYCNVRNGQLSLPNRNRLLAYSTAGHVMANHTTNHTAPDELTPEAYIASIRDAEAVLRDIPTFQKWFRYPFLREAMHDVSKHDAIKAFLADNGYRQGYVTIELYDWHINAILARAKREGKPIDLEKLRALYLRVIRESLQFYDQLALQTIQRSPVHVILMHENDLNALFISDVVGMLKTEGFTALRASQAFEDPIADPKWDPLPLSMRRLNVIARQMGYQKNTYPKWTSREALDALLKESGLIEPNCPDSLGSGSNEK